MERQTLMIPARIDAGTFRNFALYDTFVRQRRWRAPALFAVILGASAGVCFAMRRSRGGAVLLGAVLLAVGLGLPAFYVLNYLWSVRRQGKRLDGSRIAYTLHLREEGLLAVAGRERTEFPWERIVLACRARDCIYLYVSSQKAFLLPECGQSEEAWALLQEKVPPERRQDRR